MWVPNAVYGAVTPYSSIPAGLYVVSMRAHGAPATSKPVISWNLDLKAGQLRLLAARGCDEYQGFLLGQPTSAPPLLAITSR